MKVWARNLLIKWSLIKNIWQCAFQMDFMWTIINLYSKKDAKGVGFIIGFLVGKQLKEKEMGGAQSGGQAGAQSGGGGKFLN